MNRFTVFNAEHAAPPALAVIDVAQSVRRPKVRRTLAREPGETGSAFWSRVQAVAQKLADDRQEPLSWHGGDIHFLYESAAQREQRCRTDADYNYRAALTWLCGEQFAGDVRVWAATELAKLYGMLPAEYAR